MLWLIGFHQGEEKIVPEKKMRYYAAIKLIKKKKKKINEWGDKKILKFKGRKIKWSLYIHICR